MTRLAPTFWRRVEKTATCWLWTGPNNGVGYGKIKDGYVHRLAYEDLVGPIPEGFQIDHLCRVRNCVNPEHLEAVTQAENNRRSASMSAEYARRSQCSRGHEYTPENTYIYRNARYCRECDRIKSRARRAQSTIRQRERRAEKRAAR